MQQRGNPLAAKAKEKRDSSSPRLPQTGRLLGMTRLAWFFNKRLEQTTGELAARRNLQASRQLFFALSTQRTAGQAEHWLETPLRISSLRYFPLKLSNTLFERGDGGLVAPWTTVAVTRYTTVSLFLTSVSVNVVTGAVFVRFTLLILVNGPPFLDRQMLYLLT